MPRNNLLSLFQFIQISLASFYQLFIYFSHHILLLANNLWLQKYKNKMEEERKK